MHSEGARKRVCLPWVQSWRLLLNKGSKRSSDPSAVCQIQRGVGDVSGGGETTKPRALYIDVRVQVATLECGVFLSRSRCYLSISHEKLEGAVTALGSGEAKIAQVPVKLVWSVFSRGELSQPRSVSSGSVPSVCCMTKFVTRVAVLWPGWDFAACRVSCG